ncbi:substrate-binding and VWA domain-containing protein [Umezawaea beigongshangensis]|uniref:substrate-binding and VWA domain-containing protein n=1 Tax=Umezawaea beigongshangensis TaxID=2780383 RepID=UPI0018F1F7A9|nr:substrate-binding and VWA domain-containing protein [Umezawaea beigongshangensis]
MLARRSPVVLLSILLVLSLCAWAGFERALAHLRAPRCDAPAVVRVAAAPAVAQALSETAAAHDGSCYRVEVAARASADVLTGADPPDVWVPESTRWLRRARGTGAWQVPDAGTSIAFSPVVLAARTDARTWPDLLRGTVGIADPANDPAALSAVLGVRALAASEPDPAAAAVASLRRVAASSEPTTAELFTAGLDAFAVSEQELARHNATPGATPLTPVFADPPVPGLDFPYAVLPGADEARRAGAEGFLAALRSGAADATLATSRLRPPDGRGEPAARPVALPDPDTVDDALTAWAGLALSARVLAVLDVSGSMNEIVPGTGTTRMALAVEAAERGVGLFKPTTELGLWKFSTALDGEKDHQEVLPVAPVREQLSSGAVQRLRAIRATARGATGLYDTTLAAYRQARSTWAAGRINIVVIMTDGRNEDSRSISQAALLEELGKLQDQRRPLPVVAIGMGPDVDVRELERIAGATGGRAFTTADPAGVGDIFASALSTMLCQPPACRPG